MRNYPIRIAAGFVGVVVAVVFGHAIGADDVKSQKSKAQRVRLDTTENSAVSGTVAFESIRIKGELGVISIPLFKISQMVTLPTVPEGRYGVPVDPRFVMAPAESPPPVEMPLSPPPSSLGIATLEGDKFTGVVVFPDKLALTTHYGVMTLDWRQVRSLEFVRDHAPSAERTNTPAAPVAAGTQELNTPRPAPAVQATGPGRYQGVAMHEGDGFVLVDTQTGQCWERTGNAEWRDFAPPISGK